METSAKDARDKLTHFVKSLLNYSVNTATEDASKVKATHDAWLAVQMEKEQGQEMIRQEYMEKHEIPRTTAQQQYRDFLQQKKTLYHEWLRTQNHGDLYAWLRTTFEHDTKPFEDTVYTMYAKPKYL